MTLLNISNICTIDSFCLEIVKNHFYELDNVSPNFRIADSTEIEILKEEILEEMFEEKYQEEEENFLDLIRTYTGYKDDTPLKDLVRKIHNYISSTPFPKQWLNDAVEMFNLKEQDLMDKGFEQTIWGKELLRELNEEIEDDIMVLEDAKKL